MRCAAFFICGLGLFAATLASARSSLGQYGRWGAFREAEGSCLALAEPANGGVRGSRPFIAISQAPKGGPPRVHIVPGREVRPGGLLRLDIGARSFLLTGSGGRDAREDARIIAAIRAADRLRVAGTDRRGRRFHDDYPLAGAPSAIDAAIVGCL
jgi:hypothetical protein